MAARRFYAKVISGLRLITLKASLAEGSGVDRDSGFIGSAYFTTLVVVLGFVNENLKAAAPRPVARRILHGQTCR